MLSRDIVEVLNRNIACAFIKQMRMGDSEMSVENINMQGLYPIKKKELFRILRIIKVSKSIGHVDPSQVIERLCEQNAGSITKISLSGLTTGKVTQDCRVDSPMFLH